MAGMFDMMKKAASMQKQMKQIQKELARKTAEGVSGTVTVRLENFHFKNGQADYGGGVWNNGSLTLDHATLTNNTMATDAGDFWQGGGAIYNGEELGGGHLAGLECLS